MTNCNIYECPVETHYKNLQNLHEECEGDELCKEICCNEYKTCGEWGAENDCRDFQEPSPDRLLYFSNTGGTCDGKGPEYYRNEYETIRKYIRPEDICCEDMKCEDYTCLGGFKDKEEHCESLVYKIKYDDDEEANGIEYDPIEQCCERKDCDDWSTLNGCPQGTFLIPNEKGYSMDECCFTSCNAWRDTIIEEETRSDREILEMVNTPELCIRADNIDIDIDTFNVCNEDTDGSDGRSLLINAILEKMFPLLPCMGQTFLEDKLGWGEYQCCRDKRNTCANKIWKCPKGTSIDSRNLDKVCSDNLCSETDSNIELCCKDYNKCHTLSCPVNYHLNPYNLNKYCENRICNGVDDLEVCCLENEKCGTMYCGTGYSNKELLRNEICTNEKCTIKDDREKCCIENNTCSTMECPEGFYVDESSKDKPCYNQKCSTESRYDHLRCCYKCVDVINAAEVKCSSKEDSVPIKCNEGFILEGGICKRKSITLDVIIELDGSYSELIMNEEYPSEIKKDLCEMIHKEKGLKNEECMEMVEIDEIKEGSIFVSFSVKSILNTENILTKWDINEIFKKGKMLPETSLEIKEPPNIIEIVEGDNITCSDGTNKFQCPFYMKLIDNAANIYGTTSLDCCVLDWTIIKYVIPLFLIIGLIVYIIFKVKSRI